MSVTDGNVDVVINSTKLDDTLRAQVEDIVKRKTGVSADKITINICNSTRRCNDYVKNGFTVLCS